MLKIIEIAALPNGAHRNQSFPGFVPDGWALLPTDELENFPFGEVEVDTVDGLPTVTKWTPGEVPEPDPAPVPEPVSEEVTTADMAAAIMEGVNDV